MKCVQFEVNTWLKLVDSSDSKTWRILKYLIEKAIESSNDIQVTYKTIEEDLHIGHTTIGKNMRLLLKHGILEKLGPGAYRFNKQVIQVLRTEECF